MVSSIGMNVLRTLVVAGAAAVLYDAPAGALVQGQRPLTVSFAPAVIHPGDAVAITIGGAVEDDDIRATLFGGALSFTYDASDGRWRALAGVDLETKPGTYRLRITRRSTGIESTRSVTVAPKRFRVRRLRVAEGFVDPPKAALEQIARDGATLADVYARRSAKRWKGPFLPPVDGPASSNFGTRSYYNGRPRSPHAGVDFAAKLGTPVRASNFGTIAIASEMYFTGNTVVVDHGSGIISVFAHLSEFDAEAGDEVEPTTIVGRVGATGRVTGPHLHWSVRLAGARIDPLSLIAATKTLTR